MKTELTDVSPVIKKIEVSIEADVVREAYDRISDRYAKLATVPGFRRGHAPRSVVRTRFKDDIRTEVLRELLPPAIQEAINEYNLDIIGEPEVHLADEAALDKFGTEPITVHAHVEVLPEVELGEYKNLEAGRSVRPVTDEDIESVIEGLREASASLQPVEDRPSQEGDTVTVDFDGVFVETPDEEPIKVEEVDVLLGGEGVQQEFTNNLTGVHADEEKKFTVNYPDDFTSKGLAGKTVEYTAKVTAVRIKELPELDDEWAKSLGEEYDSLTVLREKVREDLMKRAESEARQRVSGILMNKLIDAHPFEVPPTLLEYQADQLLESVARDLYMRGVDPRGQETSWWSNVREQLKPQATRDLRASMLMEAIAEREKIEVSDDEIQAEIAAIAGASRQTMEQVRDALTKQGGERSIADRLRNRKALDLVLENARITDEEWREEMPDEDEPANEQQAVPEQALPETQTAADASPEASRQTDEAPDPEQADAASSES